MLPTVLCRMYVQFAIKLYCRRCHTGRTLRKVKVSPGSLSLASVVWCGRDLLISPMVQNTYLTDLYLAVLAFSRRESVHDTDECENVRR